MFHGFTKSTLAICRHFVNLIFNLRLGNTHLLSGWDETLEIRMV